VEINEETRNRIMTAANQLFEQAGRASFPTVDAVRRTARANMNDASAVMKDWRRMQTTATAVAVAVPDRVQQASQAALATLWVEAQDLAHETLIASQAAWDAERAEAEKLRVELSAAFEGQAAELDTLQGRLADLEAAAAAAEKRAGELRDQLAAMTERAGTAEARAADLRTARDQALVDAGQARDEAARLRGQNEAMQAHQAELMRAITARDDTEPGEWRKALADRLETQTADQSLDDARRIAAKYRDGKPAVEMLHEGRMWEAKREQAEEQSHG
jgi:colicin import membrane protein